MHSQNLVEFELISHLLQMLAWTHLFFSDPTLLCAQVMKVRDIGNTMGSTANSNTGASGRGNNNTGSAAGMLSSGGLGSQTAGVAGKGGIPKKSKQGFNKTQ